MRMTGASLNMIWKFRGDGMQTEIDWCPATMRLTTDLFTTNSLQTQSIAGLDSTYATLTTRATNKLRVLWLCPGNGVNFRQFFDK